MLYYNWKSTFPQDTLATPQLWILQNTVSHHRSSLIKNDLCVCRSWSQYTSFLQHYCLIQPWKKLVQISCHTRIQMVYFYFGESFSNTVGPNHVHVLFLKQKADVVDMCSALWTCGIRCSALGLCFCWVIYVEINEKQTSWHWQLSTGPQWVISECALSKAQTNELDWMKAFIKSTLNTVSSVSALRSHSAWLAL